MYDFPFLEYSKKKSEKKIVLSDEWNHFFKDIDYKIVSVSDEFVHRLSHQYIYAKFWTISINSFELENYSFVRNSALRDYPVSRLIDKFLIQYNMI